MNAYTNLREIWIEYYTTRTGLNGALHKYVPSVIPVLQPVTFLRHNLDIA
jgi:hypothetical protein